jgi:O-acetyl-ADP-ribose deacetylase (regulator of RNase III)
MITYVSGNLFHSPAQVLVNTVNCVGVMGKGLALEFKQRYPEMFANYVARCERFEVKPGVPYLWENDEVQVLNFPTKRHWRENSQLADIEAGLQYLAKNYSTMGIATIAMPPLGCGLGGLLWSQVKPLIEKYLSDLPLEVFVYEPRVGAVATNDSEDGEEPVQTKPKRRKIAAQEAYEAQTQFRQRVLGRH